MLAALAAGREVIVSRGELVEIGGGFRVPDVMAQSGAILREVGTTNRTRAADYDAAITERTAFILRVHRSNFRIEGFTETPDARRTSWPSGRRAALPVVEDLGSGNLIGGLSATELAGFKPAEVPGLEAILRDEPTVQGSIARRRRRAVRERRQAAGRAAGRHHPGPQGPRRSASARHPLMRALRVDKLTYAALTGTLVEYASGRAKDTVPILRMLTRTPADIEARARRLAERLEAHRPLRHGHRRRRVDDWRRHDARR